MHCQYSTSSCGSSRMARPALKSVLAPSLGSCTAPQVLLGLVLACVILQFGWQITMITVSRYPLMLSYAPTHVGDLLSRNVVAGPRTPAWVTALELMRRSEQKYVVVDVKNGLGNRLRALASAMAVAAELRRPVLLIWMADLHCNCSFRKMFDTPLQFALLEEEMPKQNLTEAEFQVYNYMRPEPGAVKDAPISPDPKRHLYFKSAFLMNHKFGGWTYAQREIQRLTPVIEVRERLVSDKGMVGLHVRNVFDAPRDAATNRSTVGTAAVQGAQKEYGVDGTRQLLQWRKASHWTNFVPRIISLLREHGFRHPKGLAQPPLRFYLAADAEDAYAGLIKRFPNRLLFTRRQCSAERCDFRDCTGMIFSLADMFNLARTRLILGSGWSSYSEVAAYMGGRQGKPVPMLMAGRDFGYIVSPSTTLPRPEARRKRKRWGLF
mmetsp:Transcript_13793/g.29888  ORF Transcript_13793/g.29888 Transcript_13793/m.29888 type:complete len:436 (-) Transcript_13793:122-1429(-)